MTGMAPRGSFSAYPEMNGYGPPQYYTNGMKPQIYTVSGFQGRSGFTDVIHEYKRFRSLLADIILAGLTGRLL